MKIFISVGRAANQQQTEFITAIEQLLLQHGMQPCRALFSSVQPLKKVEEVMRECDGAVIIAFERIYVERGLELRGGTDERALENERLPTVWNQVEAAMAYGMGQPLLVICEEGLRIEGLLDDRYDWHVQKLSVNKSSVWSEKFQGAFGDWKERVKRRMDALQAQKGKDSISADKSTLSEIILSMTPSQIWALGAAIVPALAGLVYLAFWLGQHLSGATH